MVPRNFPFQNQTAKQKFIFQRDIMNIHPRVARVDETISLHSLHGKKKSGLHTLSPSIYPSMIFNPKLENLTLRAIQLLISGKFSNLVVSEVVFYSMEKIKYIVWSSEFITDSFKIKIIKQVQKNFKNIIKHLVLYLKLFAYYLFMPLLFCCFTKTIRNINE